MERQVIRAGGRRTAAILVLAGALVALGPTASSAAKTPKDFYGVIPQAELTASDYANMAEGRVGTTRTSFNWASVQSVRGKCQSKAQSGVCYWGGLDGYVANAAYAGVRVLPILSGTPAFVSKRKPNKPPLKKSDLKMWRAFVQAAAERYGRGGHFWRQAYGPPRTPITSWQVWNEPNSRQFWAGRPSGRRYAKLVKASATSLRKGDRKAEIVLGGMFGDALVPLPAFLRQLYSVRGIERSFDEIAIHPYASRIGELRRRVLEARRAAGRAGDRKAGIRVTELGWSSKSGKHPLMVGTKGQAKMLKGSFRLLTKKRRSWNIEGLNWFAWQDTRNPDTCRFCRDSGLFKVNGEAKPSWRAFKRFSR